MIAKVKLNTKKYGANVVQAIIDAAAELATITGIRPTVLRVGADVNARLSDQQREQIYELAHVVVEGNGNSPISKRNAKDR